MDFTDLRLLGIDVDAGISYTGAVPKYVATLQRFYEAYSENVDRLSGYVAAGDLENYGILTHAIKGNARMIGATELADIAEQLELASKAGDRSSLNRLEELLDAYDGVVAALEPYHDMDKIQIPGEITKEEAIDICARLKLALEDCADEQAIELMDELGSYPFRISQRQKLRNAQDAVENFMYDDALEIIEDINRAI